MTWVAPRVTSFNNDTIADKSLQLHAMFPDIKEFDVKYALKKCNNDFQSALDHLLNMQYLEETGQQTRGIDGFAQLEEPRKQRKGKGKGRKREALEETKNSFPEELIQEAKGMLAGCHISKVSMLTYVPPQSKPKLATLQNASILLSMPSQRHTTTVTAHHQPL